MASIERLAMQMRASQPRGSWVTWRREAAKHGITGLDLPARFSESPLVAAQMAEVFALCGDIDLDLRELPGAGHGRLIAIAEGLSPELETLVASITDGTAYLAVAATEERAGSDMYGIQTTAIPATDGFVLSGRKQFVARLDEATHIVVFAKVGSPDKEAVTAFVVPRGAPGVSTARIGSLGLCGSSLGSLTLDRVTVSAHQVVGQVGRGFELFSAHFSYWRTAMAAAAIGCARRAMMQAISRLSSRSAFGGPIGRFTHLQQELAFHTSRLHMSWQLIVDTMTRIDTGRPFFVQAAMTKAEAVEAAIQAVDWAMRIHGAAGYSNLLDIEKRFRDLLGLRVADGTTDVLRGQVARSLLGDTIYEQSLGRRRLHKSEHELQVSSLLFPPSTPEFVIAGHATAVPEEGDE